MNWLLLVLALALAIVLAGAVIVLVWLVFGMSYTLTELLILLKDQHEARSDAAAKAVETRTRRHNAIVSKLVTIVDDLQQLRDTTSRIEGNTAVSGGDHKTTLMKASPTDPAGADASEQQTTVSAKSGHSPVLLPDPPPPAPPEAPRDSEAETQFWKVPPSGGTLVGIGAVPAK